MNETRTFEHDKTTKNTYRYEEVTDGEPPAFGKIYLQKWLIGGEAPPERIEVSVSEHEG